MKKVTTCLWFDGEAQEAAEFYTSLFADGRMGNITHYPKAASEAARMPEGQVMTVEFHMLGQDFLAMNGGPAFTFNESVSFMVNCDTQGEIDRLWDALIADGGQENVCGWLKDKYGLSWQVVPSALWGWMQEPARYAKVMEALLKMRKLDLALLRQAYEQA